MRQHKSLNYIRSGKCRVMVSVRARVECRRQVQDIEATQKPANSAHACEVPVFAVLDRYAIKARSRALRPPRIPLEASRSRAQLTCGLGRPTISTKINYLARSPREELTFDSFARRGLVAYMLRRSNDS